MILVSTENLGADPPIGSKGEGGKYERLHCGTDLNDGMGDPWAGQARLRREDLALMVSRLLSGGNFGAAPPIGSGKTTRCEN